MIVMGSREGSVTPEAAADVGGGGGDYSSNVYKKQRREQKRVLYHMNRPQGLNVVVEY